MRHLKIRAAGLIGLVLILSAKVASAGGSLDDYRRADHLAELTRNKVFRFRVQPHWFDANNQFWYRITTETGGQEYYLVNALAGTREIAFDPREVAEALSRAAGRKLTAADVNPDTIAFTDSDRCVQFTAIGKLWNYDRTAKTLAPA